MVDFCVVLDPKAMGERDSARRVDEIRTHQPEQMINHALCDEIDDKPIALSIETKKADGGSVNAQLQMSVWHTAQWNFLESLAGGAIDDDSGLAFLPGIIVEGHDWSFVATTRQQNRTVCTAAWASLYLCLPAHMLM